MLRRPVLVSVCATIVAAAANGQSPAAENRRWAPSSVLSELGIKRGLLQDLSVPRSQVPGFEVVVGLGNETHTLLLQAHDVRTRDFKLLIHDRHGLHVAPTPPNTTYRGVVLGRPESIVAASLLKGQLHAIIKLDAVTWAAQPISTTGKAAARTLHITFRSTDSLPDNQGCVALDPPNRFAPAIKAGGPALNAGAGATIYNCELACDADNSYFLRHGSDVTATQNDVVRVINGVGAIFRSDVDIDYRITNVIIRKQVIYTAVRDSQAVIQEFRTYWKRNHSKVVRDLCHLFTDRSMYNVIGVGWVGVVCRDLGYAVSRSLSPVNILNRYTLTAHELGHNWGCPHCSNPPTTCDIMCGRTDPCFSDVSKDLIRAHRDISSCLQKIDPRPNLIAVRKPSRGEQMAWSYKAGPRHFWFLTISPTNTYTPALGFKFMDNSLLLLNGQVDQWGLGHSSVTVPSSTTIGLRFYSQLVTVHSIKQSISGTSLIIGTTVQ